MRDSVTYIVGDLHLGTSGAEVARRFHDFLAQVPQPGDQLLILGDLFDFWFEYRRVVLRRPFRTLCALQATRERGIAITFVGGNHDRWGGDFLTGELGIRFFDAGEAELDVAGQRAYVHHGDGLTEERGSARFLHWVTRRRAVIALFRAIHPDVGCWIADRLAVTLADSTRSPEVVDQAARAQESWARDLLARRPDLHLVVMGHTHRPALVDVGGRHYVNPGAFFDGGRYAVATAEGPRLALFTGAAGAGSPTRPHSAPRAG